MKCFSKRLLIRRGTLLAAAVILFVIFRRLERYSADVWNGEISNDELNGRRTESSFGTETLPPRVDSLKRESTEEKVDEKMTNFLHVEKSGTPESTLTVGLAKVQWPPGSYDVSKSRSKADFSNEQLTTEEINERWSWSSFDAENAPKRNTGDQHYTEEELTSWVEKPMYSFDYPGKFGDPYIPENVTKDEQKRIDEGWKKYQFNEFVCSKIPLHRYLSDDREDVCKARRWKKPLPTASVVIVFYNEAWCTLMRTIFSVLETSPKILLKEIVLIDDASSYKNLKSELDEYVKQLKIVRLIRMKKRLGVASARMAGARASSGQVIVFLDAHCECTRGWLEPLLERIADEPKALVAPVIEDMPFDTFSMKFRDTKSVPIGVTTWDLSFGWGWQRDRPVDEPNDAPIKSPVVVGVSAIRRSYFFEIGGFDEELQVWGAEQIEISFKIWLCGGTLEIHPCSHVGHMHRKGFQYARHGKSIARNTRRVAEVWLDEYKERYFRHAPIAKFVDPGDLSAQIELRERMRCKKFDWFLKNIQPGLYAVPKSDVVYWGQWATDTGIAATCCNSGDPISNPMILYPCSSKSSHQLLMLTRQGEMRLNTKRDWCMVPSVEWDVVFEPCIYPTSRVPEKQRWSYIQVTDSEGNISTNSRGVLHHSSGLCLENIRSTIVKLMPCQESQSQIWFYRNITEELGYMP